MAEARKAPRVGWKGLLVLAVAAIVVLLVVTDDQEDHARRVPGETAAPPAPATAGTPEGDPDVAPAPTPSSPAGPEARPPPPRTSKDAPPRRAAPAPAEAPLPEAASLLTDAVRAAVLALPSVVARREGATVLQRPTGEPVALSVTHAAGGGWRLRVAVDVARHVEGLREPTPVRVIAAVLVDARRVPLQARTVGESDPEFEALFED